MYVKRKSSKDQLIYAQRGSGEGVGQRQLLLMCFCTYYKVHWLIVWPGPSKKVTERVEQIGRRAGGSAKGGRREWEEEWVWDLGRGSSSCDRLDCSHFHLVYLTQTNRAPKLVSFSLSSSLSPTIALPLTHSISLARYTTVERRPAKRTKQLSQLTNQLMLFTLFPLSLSLFFSFSTHSPLHPLRFLTLQQKVKTLKLDNEQCL